MPPSPLPAPNQAPWKVISVTGGGQSPVPAREQVPDDLVSIITPAFNCEQFIPWTIESVINQTYPHWEMILIDDASTDGTRKVIQGLAEREARLRLISLPENSGSAVARNTGLKAARSDLIAFLDSDDLWQPEKLARQVAFMRKYGHPITFTSYQLIDEGGHCMNRTVRAVPRLNQEGYLKTTLIGCSTAIVDRSLTGPFSFLNIRTRQDTHLWITLLGRGLDAFGLDEVLVKYRVRSDSISANKFKAAWQVWNLYRNIAGLGFFRAAYFFGCYLFNAVKKRL